MTTQEKKRARLVDLARELDLVGSLGQFGMLGSYRRPAGTGFILGPFGPKVGHKMGPKKK